MLPQFQFDSIIPHLLIKSTPKNFNFFLIYFRLFKIQFSALIVSFPFALMESQNSINSSSSMRGRCEERERVNPACLLKTFWRGNLSFFVCFFYELLPFFCFISTQLWEHIVMINIHTHSTQLCVSRTTRRKKNWIFFITNCLFSQNIIWERERDDYKSFIFERQFKKNEIKFTYDDFHREGGNKVCHDNFISTVTKKLN